MQGENCCCLNRRTTRSIARTLNGLNLSSKLWELSFIKKALNPEERRKGNDKRQTTLRCVVKQNSTHSSDEEEEEEEEEEEVEDVETHGQRGGRDAEELEDGELRSGTPDGSRQVALDESKGLVVRRDLRGQEETRDFEEEAVNEWVGTQNETERRDEERYSDRDFEYDDADVYDQNEFQRSVFEL